MKNFIKLEEIGMFILSYLITLQLDYSWWLFFALLLLPDLSMVGYAINTKAGAIIYNFFHHKATAIIAGVIGYYLKMDWLLLTGIILFGHSSMDRAFGYGLKYSDNFKNTHLGRIGGKQ